MRWAIIDKEFYPIIVAVTRLRHFLVRSNGFRLFTDHRNLVYILDPAGRSVPKHVDDRLERWSMRLSGLFYIIEYIASEYNIWANMLIRQAFNKADKSLKLKVPSGIVSPLLEDDFIWPTFDEVEKLQQEFSQEIHKKDLVRSPQGLCQIHLQVSEKQRCRSNDWAGSVHLAYQSGEGAA